MGLAWEDLEVRWVGVKGAAPQTILDRLGWVETGEWSLDQPLALAKLIVLPSGWQIIVEQSLDAPLDPEAFVDLGEVVTGASKPDALVSRVRGPGWDIDFHPEQYEALQVRGSPPTAFDAARQAAAKAGGEQSPDAAWRIALEVSEAICGFDPENPAPPTGAVISNLERVRTKGAGIAQAGRARAGKSFAAQVKARLFPQISALGFLPDTKHPDCLPGAAYPNCFLRSRDGLTDELVVSWGMNKGRAQVILYFMTRKPRAGLSGEMGSARTRWPRRPNLIDRLFRVAVPPAKLTQNIEQAIVDAVHLLEAVDRYMAQGMVHPRLELPKYLNPLD
jgi:hypothetical protein